MLTQTFRHDPTAPGVRVWRRSRWGALGNALAIAFFVPLALSEAVLGIYMLATGVVMGVGVALFLWLCAAGIGALTRLVWRDMQGKRSGAIALTSTGIRLDLCAGRSSTNTTDAVHELIPYADLRALETRLEAYPSAGMAKMVRTFRLTRRSGPPVFLFEERGLGMFDDGIMQPLADEIMARASIPVSDFGMVEGGGGILAAWFLTVPDWSTPSVSVDRQRELWGRVDRTNRLARPRVYGD